MQLQSLFMCEYHLIFVDDTRIWKSSTACYDDDDWTTNAIQMQSYNEMQTRYFMLLLNSCCSSTLNEQQNEM